MSRILKKLLGVFLACVVFSPSLPAQAIGQDRGSQTSQKTRLTTGLKRGDLAYSETLACLVAKEWGQVSRGIFSNFPISGPIMRMSQKAQSQLWVSLPSIKTHLVLRYVRQILVMARLLLI